MTEASTTICLHLLPFLTELRAQGSSVVQVDEGGWSNCILSVNLDEGPSIIKAEEVFILPAGVKLWHNDDGHYAIENGLFCEQCRHSLSWPRAEEERATPGDKLMPGDI